jgi:hypothetical protein
MLLLDALHTSVDDFYKHLKLYSFVSDINEIGTTRCGLSSLA